MARIFASLLIAVLWFHARPVHAQEGVTALIHTAAEADAWLDRYGPSPAPDPVGSEASVRMKRLVAAMDAHWRRLEARCDPAAVFALTYLITTRGIARHVEAGYFDDGDGESVIMVAFAARYFAAYEDFAAGHPERVSRPWREALEAGAGGYTTVMEDVFLGMNAHINYNLGEVMAEIGLVDAQGRSRKPDHDRINHVLASVMDEISTELARFYDPSMAPGDGLNPLAAPAVLELIYSWRENAWHNAEARSALPDAQPRAVHDAYMQQTAYLIAKGIQTPKQVPTAPARRAFCQDNP